MHLLIDMHVLCWLRPPTIWSPWLTTPWNSDWMFASRSSLPNVFVSLFSINILTVVSNISILYFSPFCTNFLTRSKKTTKLSLICHIDTRHNPRNKVCRTAGLTFEGMEILHSDWLFSIPSRININERYLPFYLTIRPRGRMDYESIAHEAVGRMGYSTRSPWGREV